MAKVVWLPDHAHRQAQSVLPWYVTGRLDDDERNAVEDHLENCAACREDLVAEREIATLLNNCTPDTDTVEHELPPRIRAAQNRSRHRQRWTHATPAARKTPARSGWVLASSAIAASLIVIAVTPRPDRAEYHALGAQANDSSGNLIVIFRPDTSEREFRSTLASSQARLVDGPTASGAYILRVPQAERAAILDRLQRQENVVLAQPLDADPAK